MSLAASGSQRCAVLRPLRPINYKINHFVPPRRRVVQRIRADNGNKSPSASSFSTGASSWEHVLVAIVDSNPTLSTASRAAVDTAASLANKGKLTIMFLDENAEGKPQDISPARIELVQRQLEDSALGELSFIEESIEPSSGKGSVAVGEAADTLGADLVVMSTAAVHERHVDANLLAEFVPAPVLLLP